MCITVNNIEHVFKHLQPLALEISLSSVGSQDSQEKTDYQGDTNELINSALDHIDSLIYKVLNKISVELETGLKKNVFHLAWSPDTLPTEEAICPLTTFLSDHLTNFNNALLNGNFLRSLHVLWDSVLFQLKEHTDTSNGEKMPLFYDRLHEALQILSDYFLSDGRGLEPERLYNDCYRDLDVIFGLAKMSTDQLIAEYHRERLNEQYSITVPEFGVLDVRVYFRHDSLCVEVFSARDVIPLDPTGLSDPYVIIELLPKRIFPNCPERSTAVQKATLNPQFDETFEFSCRREQCRDPEAVICFTVMDYDVITANDFGGEAFISLNTVSGVEHGSSSVDNFHGLKPLQLALMFQKQKDHPILKTLEERTSDKLAQECLKRQKERIQD